MNLPCLPACLLAQHHLFKRRSIRDEEQQVDAQMKTKTSKNKANSSELQARSREIC